MAKFLIFGMILLPAFVSAKSNVRDCAQPERWAASMVQTQLKNAGIVRNEDIDFSKTKVSLLAQEKLKKDLYHQIQKVTYVKKNGEELTAITENDASSQECSVSGVKVYLVQKELGP